MKTTTAFLMTSLVAAVVFAACSSFPSKSESGKDLSSEGPTVLNARSEPGTIELNQSLEPLESSSVLADVKDFTSTVSDVKLKFQGIPVEVPMKNIGGTTWRADLTKNELQSLAVSGKTIKYDAHVVARDKEGRSAMTSDPITIAIKTPELTGRTPAESRKQKKSMRHDWESSESNQQQEY